MKKTTGFAFLCTILCICASCTNEEFIKNSRINFDQDWLFSKTTDSLASKLDYADSTWRNVNLPHDWAIEDSVSEKNPSGIDGGFFAAGQGWYRKHFKVDKTWKNRQVQIQFDGVFMNSDVWLNGQHIGHHSYGYIGFIYDLTPYLRFDTINVLSVKVDNSNPPASRWYTGSGIYRHVWLLTAGELDIPLGGIFISSDNENKDSTKVFVQTLVSNISAISQKFSLRHEIIDKSGMFIASADNKFELPIGKTLEDKQIINIKKPMLWTIQTPNLYTLRTTITKGIEPQYVTDNRFGIRTIAFDTVKGFLLNNEKVILKGVCIHHDIGSLGAAVPDGAINRQLKLLKELGCNSIRLSHNPHSPVLLDMCDSMGILVINEMYDKWSNQKSGYNTTEIFEKESEADLQFFVKRDRNHPAVILWTVGNETDEQLFNPEKGSIILKRLMGIVKTFDPGRKVSCAMHPGINGIGPISELIHQIDVVCYNYRTHDFPEWKKKYPGYCYLSSETKAYQEGTVPSAKVIDYEPNTWFLMEKYPFIAGQYIWAGIDYLGESMRWPNKGLTNGLLYTTGFFKPYAYFTQSVYAEKPMVHIAVVDDSIAYTIDTTKHWQKIWFGPAVVSHWNFNKTKTDKMTVLTYSNCLKVELFVNGKSQGIKQLSDFPDRVIKWTIPYESGSLEAVGRNGQTEVRHMLKTAAEASQLSLIADKKSLKGNGTDVSAIEINLTDTKGVICPKARNRVELQINGSGKILGVDNGDLSYHGLYQTNTIELRNGKALVWVQASDKKGDLSLTVTSAGMKPDTLKLNVE